MNISFPGLNIGEFTIDPIAIPIGDGGIRWYALFIVTGMIFAVLYTAYRSKHEGIVFDTILDFAIFTIPVGIIGARLYYVFFDWVDIMVNHKVNTYQSFMDVIAIWNGGLAIYGGVIFGTITIFVVAKVKKLSAKTLLKITDAAGPGVMMAQAIGRWGNFFNQEAHGGAVTNPDWQFFPYAVYIDSPKGAEEVGWYQATFFYESVWCLIIFGVLLYLFFRQKYYGQLTLWYLALYGFERGIVEWLRTDQLTVGGLPVSALLSIVLFVGATTALIVLKIKKYEHPLPYYKRGEKPEEEKADA